MIFLTRAKAYIYRYSTDYTPSTLVSVSAPDRPTPSCTRGLAFVHGETPIHKYRSDAGRRLLWIGVRSHIQDSFCIEYHQICPIALPHKPTISRSNNCSWTGGQVGNSFLQASREDLFGLHLLEIVTTIWIVKVSSSALGQVSSIVADISSEGTPSSRMGFRGSQDPVATCKRSLSAAISRIARRKMVFRHPHGSNAAIIKHSPLDDHTASVFRMRHDLPNIALVTTVHQDSRVKIVLLQNIDIGIKRFTLLLLCNLGNGLADVLISERRIGHSANLEDVPLYGNCISDENVSHEPSCLPRVQP